MYLVCLHTFTQLPALPIHSNDLAIQLPKYGPLHYSITAYYVTKHFVIVTITKLYGFLFKVIDRLKYDILVEQCGGRVVRCMGGLCRNKNNEQNKNKRVKG